MRGKLKGNLKDKETAVKVETPTPEAVKKEKVAKLGAKKKGKKYEKT